MPTVPGDPISQAQAMLPRQGPTPEQLLMTAADMQARGQLTDGQSSFSDIGANPKVSFGHGPRHPRSAGKRR